MENIVADYLNSLKTGRRQSFRNLTLYPLLSDYTLRIEYMLLTEALNVNMIKITELDESGSVPELRVVNSAPMMVLLLDGEELVGAKQNRIVNTTILIDEHSSIVIPVSCVEQGRWSYRGREFHTQERVMSYSMRSMKSQQVRNSLNRSGRHTSDQGAIWDEIRAKASRREAESPSMAMSEIYEKERPSIEEYVKHFRPIGGQVGAVFVINGKVAGMDSFGKADTFRKVFKKMVESYALDAIDWFDPDKEHKVLRSAVTGFIRASQTSDMEKHPSVGLGDDLRIESKRVSGFALCHEDEVIHLSVFMKEELPQTDTDRQRISRYSQRRRNRR